MRVLNRDQERFLDQLLQVAGGSEVLERALIRARAKVGDEPSLEHVLLAILEIKREAAQARVRDRDTVVS